MQPTDLPFNLLPNSRCGSDYTPHDCLHCENLGHTHERPHFHLGHCHDHDDADSDNDAAVTAEHDCDAVDVPDESCILRAGGASAVSVGSSAACILVAMLPGPLSVDDLGRARWIMPPSQLQGGHCALIYLLTLRLLI